MNFAKHKQGPCTTRELANIVHGRGYPSAWALPVLLNQLSMVLLRCTCSLQGVSEPGSLTFEAVHCNDDICHQLELATAGLGGRLGPLDVARHFGSVLRQACSKMAY